MADAVAVTTASGERRVGLADARYRAGPADGPQQDRLIVATTQDGSVLRLDTALARVEIIDSSKADLVERIVGDRLAEEGAHAE